MTDHASTSILSDIAAVHRRFSEALFNRQHDALASFFTADTLLLPPNKPLVRGRDDAVAFWTAATSNPAMQVRSQFDAIDSTIAGDVVIETGRATVFALVGGQEKLLDHGKYVVVWKQEGGRWKIDRDIFNSDAPRP